MKWRTFSASTSSEFIGIISSEVFDEYDAFNCMDSSVDEDFDCSCRVQSFWCDSSIQHFCIKQLMTRYKAKSRIQN